MSEPRAPLGRIIVAGSGQIGIASAIALRRALPRCEVILLPTEADPLALADNATTALPFTNKLHDRIGIDEARLVAQASGSHRLATRYLGWSGIRQQGMLTYGSPDSSLRTAFIRDWGGGPRNMTERKPPGALAEVLAGAGRFAVVPEGRPTPLSEVDYALRWNPAAYLRLLASLADTRGIRQLRGRMLDIEPDALGGIASLTVEGHGSIQADLFVDCSGPKAVLLSRLSGFGWHDWREFTPTRKLFLAAPGEPMLALEDRFALFPDGWLQEIAGRDGLQMVMGADGAVDISAVSAVMGEEPVASFDLEQGRVEAPWIGNVVALGDAAARFEPLGHLNLDLAHRQLALLLELLPGRAIEPLERAEYNRRSGLMMDGARDTLSLHFAASRVRAVFPSLAVPETVAALIDQFERRGRIPFREEAPFLTQEYRSLLGALGFMEGRATSARAIADDEILAARREFDRRVRAALDYAPAYGEWLQSILHRGEALRE